jgi:hypothetical protein
MTAKTLFSVLFLLTGLFAQAQKTPTELAQPIVAEGKQLYRSEMASWYRTDLFLEQYQNQDNISGYFSYTTDQVSKCVFFSKADPVKVIGTISFDSTYNTKTAKVDLKERAFTKDEKDLFVIRQAALKQINQDTLFKTYKNTNLNLIPIIYDGKRSVFILTGPQKDGIVIFGNDYLISFDKENKITDRKRLHRNIIPMDYEKVPVEGSKPEAGVHSHTPETGDFITSTDICTLMLYEKFAKWKSHMVVSEKYLNIWNCETNTLVVVPRETLNSKDENQGKKN